MKKLVRVFLVLVLCYTNLQVVMANATGEGIGKLHPRLNRVSNLFAAPDAPTNLVVTPINTGGMIQFTAPANDGGSAITNYEYSTDNGATWVTPSPAVTSSPLIISSGLTNCTNYQVKIRAVNAAGNGTESAAVQLIPATSVDMGVNWTSRTSAADNQWFSVTYGNGVFVAVSATGSGNRVMTSVDGEIWTARTSAANNQWISVTYGNGLFVAVAISGTGNRVMTSPNGITWTSRTSAADNNWTSVTYGNGLFVAVANSGSGNRVMTSSNGINWTARTSAADNLWRSVTYGIVNGNGLFVAVSYDGSNNRVMTSPDGITWTIRTPAADNEWRSVTYGNGLFVAVASTGTGNQVMTSPDGITWTARTSAAANEWRSVTYGNGLFVAVASLGTSNQVMTSVDGEIWTARTSAANNQWISVTYGNGVFVAVAQSGPGNRVMTSGYDVVADAPVITSAPVSQSEATVSFTQSTPALAPAITNYRYSIDNGSTWTTLSPASTTSPITITGITDFTNQIQLQAINSVGTSCPASYSLALVAVNLNKAGQKSSTPSEFVNKNGALGISGIRATGESRINTPFLSATAAVTSITATTATSGGTVAADGGASVTARGVCWSTTSNPTIANSKTTDGTGTGTFTSAITGLTSGTTYYIRSYATNSVGTTYGPEVIFTRSSLTVGTSYQGGIIAYILVPGDPGYDANTPHGLIAATSDQSTGRIPWSGDDTVTGATGTAIGTGFSNTNTIITSAVGASTSYAAGLARAHNGGGYNDWYLPSIDELKKLQSKKNIIGGFADEFYWSSTEFNDYEDGKDALALNFADGSEGELSRLDTYKVRAVRTF